MIGKPPPRAGSAVRLAPAHFLIGGLTALPIAVFAVVPLVLVLGAAVRRSGAPFVAELREPGALDALQNSMLLAVSVTVSAVPVGVALAWLIERTNLFPSERSRARLSALLALPVAIPPYLLAMAWALLGNGRNGLLNRIVGANLVDLYGFGGIVLVLASGAYPFAMLATLAALRNCDPALEEAARISGAGTRRVLFDVSLPLVLPAIASSAGLIFIFAAAAFGVPYLLGSAADPPISFLTTRIYQHTMLGGAEMLERAAALSVILIALPGAAHLITARIVRPRSSIQISGKASRPSSIGLGRARTPTRGLVYAFAIVFVITPVLMIVWTSVQKTFADPWTLSADHWIGVLSRSETRRAFTNSVLLAMLAGAIVAALGLAVAWLAKAGARGGEWLIRAAALPYAVPGTVLAIGLILTYAREVRVVLLERVSFILDLPGTMGMLLIAYAVKYLAFGVKGARAALDQVDPSLEEAARLSGAGAARSAVDITLPLVSPSVTAAFLLVALPCLSELTMSVLLFGTGTETAGTLLFELQSYSDPPSAAVVASLIVVLAFAGQLALGGLRSSGPKRDLVP